MFFPDTMGIAILVVPMVNKLGIYKTTCKEKVSIPLLASAVKHFTVHMEGGEQKPSLLKVLPDPDNNSEGGIKTFMREMVTNSIEKWAFDWGIQVA